MFPSPSFISDVENKVALKIAPECDDEDDGVTKNVAVVLEGDDDVIDSEVYDMVELDSGCVDDFNDFDNVWDKSDVGES